MNPDHIHLFCPIHGLALEKSEGIRGKWPGKVIDIHWCPRAPGECGYKVKIEYSRR